MSELQTDYIDVYKLHNAHSNILKNETVLETFAKLKKEGLVRAAGVSTYAVQETQLAIEQGVWDVYNCRLTCWTSVNWPFLIGPQKAGIGIVIRSVLLKGILSDKGRNLHPALKTVQEYRERYQSLLDDNVSSLSVLATKICLGHLPRFLLFLSASTVWNTWKKPLKRLMGTIWIQMFYKN